MHRSFWTRPTPRIAAAWAPTMLLAASPVTDRVFHLGVGLSIAITVAIVVRAAAAALGERLCEKVLGMEQVYVRSARSIMQAVLEFPLQGHSDTQPFPKVDIHHN